MTPMTAQDILAAMPETRALTEWARVLHGVRINFGVQRKRSGVLLRVRWSRGDSEGEGVLRCWVFDTPEEEGDPTRRDAALTRADRDVARGLVVELIIPLIGGNPHGGR